MATLILPLLLLVGLQGFALTATYDINRLQSVPNETGDVCQDCTQIFTLLADMISNADLQELLSCQRSPENRSQDQRQCFDTMIFVEHKNGISAEYQGFFFSLFIQVAASVKKKITGGLDALCARLPGQAGKFCKEEVDKMLPVAITFITGFVKPAEICKLMGLCGSSEEREKMLSYFLNEALQAAEKSDNGEPATHCSFCILFFKTLEDLLPKERTEEAVIKLLEEICHILPGPYRNQCEVIISKFSKTVLDAILGYATPQAICALIHLCKGQEAVVDPCTLSTYRCRDISTALKCGTLFYCQKFAWKPLSYNTI